MRCIRLTLFLLLPVLLFGCSGGSTESAGEQQSQEQASESPRFAVFSPAIGVMLRDLGFEDDIVGRHSYDNALSTAIPVVGSHMDIDTEKLISVEPTILIFEQNSIEIPGHIRELAEDREWTIWTYKLESLDDIAQTIDDLYLKLVGFPADRNSDDDPTTFEVDPTERFNVELPSARLVRAWSNVGDDAQAAGRTLLLAGTDPAGALGPGSFHAQMIERMGIESAVEGGGMWQELDLEDVIRLAPDSILLFSSLPVSEDPQFGEPKPLAWDETLVMLGPLAGLPIPAIEHQRVAVIRHPQALLPSSTLAQVAGQVRKTLAAWRERESVEP